MDKTTLTRKELYELVWSEPLTSLSQKLNVPYDDLRKVCSRMNIPLSQSGSERSSGESRLGWWRRLYSDLFASEQDQVTRVQPPSYNPLKSTDRAGNVMVEVQPGYHTYEIRSGNRHITNSIFINAYDFPAIELPSKKDFKRGSTKMK